MQVDGRKTNKKGFNLKNVSGIIQQDGVTLVEVPTNAWEWGQDEVLYG